MSKNITKEVVLEAMSKHPNPISARELARKLGVYNTWNTVEMCLYQLFTEGKIDKQEKFYHRINTKQFLGGYERLNMNKALFKDVKMCINIVAKTNKRLADRLDDFIMESLINMPLNKSDAVVWEKWFYEEK
jgi:predicted transcriptional regulator